MYNLQLVKSEPFNNIQCDFYQDNEQDILMTREQIGQALEYKDPRIAIAKIHTQHADRLDKFSGVTVLVTPGGRQQTIVYNAKGVYEICRHSHQPKANAFIDWVWDVIESLRTGNNQLMITPAIEACIKSMVNAAINQRIGTENILSPIVISYLMAIKKAIDNGEYYLLPKSKKKIKEVNQSGVLLGVYDEFCYYLFSNMAYEIYVASTTEPVNRKAIYAIMADTGIIRKGATEATEPKCIKGITRSCIVIYKDKVKGLL